jgi:hypothetical protein
MQEFPECAYQPLRQLVSSENTVKQQYTYADLEKVEMGALSLASYRIFLTECVAQKCIGTENEGLHGQPSAFGKDRRRAGGS